jgi:hypothetical protein
MKPASFITLHGRWIAWAIVFAAGLAYGAMLVVTIPHLAALSGGRPIFDMRPGGYSFSEAKDLLGALGGEGRLYYLEVQQRLDTLFPLLNAATAAIALAAFIPRALWPEAPRFVRSGIIVFLAAPCALLDWGENWAVARLLTERPDAVTPAAASLASWFTVAKSIWVTLTYSTVLAAFGLWILRRRAARGQR